MNLPCGDNYDSKKSVWCKKLEEKNFNTHEFHCDHYAKCIGMVEDDICGCLSGKSMHVVKTKEPIKEALIKEFEHTQEFAKAI